jgi:hypothetical protein
MRNPEFIGKEGRGIPAYIFSGTFHGYDEVTGASGHPYLVHIDPMCVHITDSQDFKLHYWAIVSDAHILDLSVQSYCRSKTNETMRSPDLFIGRLFSSTLAYFQSVGTMIGEKHDDYRFPRVYGGRLYPNNNWERFHDGIPQKDLDTDVLRERVARTTWSGQNTLAHGFDYVASEIEWANEKDIKSIGVIWRKHA